MILSVVIPTHGKRPLLERTLEALRGQDPGTEAWQIVVVDDASPDDTADFLRDLAGAEPRLSVVRPPVNVGRAAARNLGWRTAVGRWIIFLDDDILAPPGLLRAHLEVLRGDPALGTIGPAVTSPEIADACHFHYLDTRGVARLPAGPAPARYFVTQNAGVPRSALERIGGFDEGFSAYGFEDMDLGFRLEDAGVRFRVLPEPIPLHLHHHTLAQYLEKKKACGRHSLDRLAERHPHRLQEMRLALVVDPRGMTPAPAARLLRVLLARLGGPLASELAQRWPNSGNRPWAARIYCRVMDAAVLGAFCQGRREASKSANMAQTAP